MATWMGCSVTVVSAPHPASQTGPVRSTSPMAHAALLMAFPFSGTTPDRLE
jgi:hypothetical protein